MMGFPWSTLMSQYWPLCWRQNSLSCVCVERHCRKKGLSESPYSTTGHPTDLVSGCLGLGEVQGKWKWPRVTPHQSFTTSPMDGNSPSRCFHTAGDSRKHSWHLPLATPLAPIPVQACFYLWNQEPRPQQKVRSTLTSPLKSAPKQQSLLFHYSLMYYMYSTHNLDFRKLWEAWRMKIYIINNPNRWLTRWKKHSLREQNTGFTNCLFHLLVA